jgi:hypothetical protein
VVEQGAAVLIRGLSVPGAALLLSLAAAPCLGEPVGADGEGTSISVRKGRVYASVPATSLESLLLMISAAAGIKLELHGPLPGTSDLFASGKPLPMVLDRVLPEGAGFVIEYDARQHPTRLIVVAPGASWQAAPPTSDRQRYIARQLGRYDNDTAEILGSTLADRSVRDPGAKLQAIEQLANTDSDYARDMLLKGLGDGDPQVRLEAIRVLYDLRGDEVITLVGQAYYAETSTEMRRTLAEMVSRSSHPLALELLREEGLPAPVKNNE